MKTRELELEQRTHEWFHTVRIPPGMWTIIRVDGRSFSKLTQGFYKKPFDESFSNIMVQTAESLMKEFGAHYAYTESDEISLLLPPNFDMFGRSHEKLVSVSAGLASAEFSSFTKLSAHFDSRVWIGASRDDVLDYFSWRQADAMRCGLNGWCYWTLRNTGMSARQATSELESRRPDEKITLLQTYRVNVDDLPSWHFRGVGLLWKTFYRIGFDPIKKVDVRVSRRRIETERNLPMHEEYRSFLNRLSIF